MDRQSSGYEEALSSTDPVAAPMLGEHSEMILRDVLGYDADRIDALRASGAVKMAGRAA